MQRPRDKQALYDKLLATHPKIERKGAANPYTSLNGHMFTYLNPSGTLALRLPEKEREEFLKKYKTTLFEDYGAAMKEYVTVPDSLFQRTKELSKYLDLSYAYIKSLKTKTHEEEVLSVKSLGEFSRGFLFPTNRYFTADCLLCEYKSGLGNS
jgi:hypothetical protein